MFVDADCLCLGPLDSAFAQLAGHVVAVVGGAITKGESIGDVASICQRFEVPSLPKFNGGMYYLECRPAGTKVYEMARRLGTRYDKIGLVWLRNRPNNELLIAIAMAVHGLSAVPDNGTMLGDLLSYAGPAFQRETHAVAVAGDGSCPVPSARTAALARYLPRHGVVLAKNVLRPAYHLLRAAPDCSQQSIPT
ncbi:MAG TPA: hypothetical protein VHZ24_21780 [Pirellulales bacterium]|nr:hypothetical protein [Pirellulales bacterium]